MSDTSPVRGVRLGIGLALLLAASAAACADVLYVDDSAPPGGDGQSWATPFKYLADALYVADIDTEVRIAGGDYYPNQHELYAAPPAVEVFTLKDGMQLAGGYAGYGAPDPDLRDPALYPSQLRGYASKSHVVYAQQAAIDLDGITLRDCENAGLSGGPGCLWILDVTLRATNCRFVENNAQLGGGVYAQYSDVEFVDCVFAYNQGVNSNHSGAGFFAEQSTVRVQRCEFSENAANHSGGAICCDGGSLNVVDSTFRANAGYLQGCTILTDGVEPNSLVNCLMYENDGGIDELFVSWGTPMELINCTIIDNRSSQLAVLGDGVNARNCIVRNRDYKEFSNTSHEVTYSNIEGGYAGAGNIDALPLFVDPAGDDYHLAAGSPCIDAADNGSVPPGVLFDLDGAPRFVDDPATPDTGLGTPPIVDMGCYEFQVGFAVGDLNCDGAVDFGDINPFVLALSDPAGYAARFPGCDRMNADINGDGAVDFGDINAFVALLAR